MGQSSGLTPRRLLITEVEWMDMKNGGYGQGTNKDLKARIVKEKGWFVHMIHEKYLP